MAIKYKVEVLTATGWEHVKHGLTITAAWRVVEHHAKRGARLHGGTIARANWGARGGNFPARYRYAVITLDN